jgi:hypothetical protein
MDLCSTIVTRQALCRGQQWFGAGYHMIYAPAAYVVTFARLYSYGQTANDLRTAHKTSAHKTFAHKI